MASALTTFIASQRKLLCGDSLEINGSLLSESLQGPGSAALIRRIEAERSRANTIDADATDRDGGRYQQLFRHKAAPEVKKGRRRTAEQRRLTPSRPLPRIGPKLRAGAAWMSDPTPIRDLYHAALAKLKKGE